MNKCNICLPEKLVLEATDLYIDLGYTTRSAFLRDMVDEIASELPIEDSRYISSNVRIQLNSVNENSLKTITKFCNQNGSTISEQIKMKLLRKLSR